MPTAKSSGGPPLDDQLGFALYGASMAINRACKPILDRLEITYTQYLVLHTLWEVEGGLAIGEIAEALCLEPSTVTPLVKRMEAAGLVDRARSHEDERQVSVKLTRKGQEMEVSCRSMSAMLETASGFSPGKLADLNARVRRFRNAVNTYLLGIAPPRT